MINDSFVRLDALEGQYKKLQESHSKLLNDYAALGGRITKDHMAGSVDPDDDCVKIVLSMDDAITLEEAAEETLNGLRVALKGFLDNNGKEQA